MAQRTAATNDGTRSTGSPMPCMQGGGGADSYAANSNHQIRAFHAYAKPHLAEAVRLAVDNMSNMRPSRIAGSNNCTHVTVQSKEAAKEFEEGERAAGDHCSNYRAGAHHVAVADLGCSYGENALAYADFIAHAFTEGFLGLTNTHSHTHNSISDHPLDLQYPAATIKDVPDSNNINTEGRAMMEIQYFFSDLPSNDFNHLFRSLAVAPNRNTFSCSSSIADDDQALTTRAYAAGVPGSFYDRLFPSRSLNFVSCAFALHWLSQVPSDVLDKSSPSWNKGHVWFWGNGQTPEVAKAFARQSKADLIHFFRCRAEEMAKDAIMFLFTLARDEDDDYPNLYNRMGCGFVDDTWNEMVNEGIISCEEMDTFNIPKYVVSREELELALKEVPELKILKLELIEDLANQVENHSLRRDPQEFGKTSAKFFESILKPMIQAHIGLQRTTLFFERLESVTTKNACLPNISLTTNYLVAICQRC